MNMWQKSQGEGLNYREEIFSNRGIEEIERMVQCREGDKHNSHNQPLKEK